MQKLRPIQNKVVIKRHDAEKVTEGGIHLAPGAVEKPLKGTVIAVGPGQWLGDNEKFVETVVKKGDVVIFGERAGETVEVDDIEYLVMPEHMILAVISDE